MQQITLTPARITTARFALGTTHGTDYDAARALLARAEKADGVHVKLPLAPTNAKTLAKALRQASIEARKLGDATLAKETYELGLTVRKAFGVA